jgi:hypothetical protein
MKLTKRDSIRSDDTAHRSRQDRSTIFQRGPFAMRAFGALTTAMILAAGAPRGEGAVIYVSASQTNNVPDGASWPTAFKTVQQAILAASYGDAVWVAAGTYFENITLSNGVALYGGFNGTETDLSQRNWNTNFTILDGHQNNSVVVIAPGATNTTRVDGFTIRNGKALAGGGVWCSNASPCVFNNIIIGNQATNGGGIWCYASASPEIALNLIQENFTAGGSGIGAGAGIFCNASAARIHNNRIMGNTATGQFHGGGIACVGSPSPDIFNNLILGNTASPGSDGSGGIFVFNDCAPHIINNTLVWNDGPAFGAGIYYYSPFHTGTNFPVIVNNIVAFGASGIGASPVGGLPVMIFKNNCVFGNGAYNYFVFPNQTGTNGNISQDPLFLPNNSFPEVHLSAVSPCRDAGDSAATGPDWVDLDGAPRITGIAVDIGADEFDGTPPSFTPTIVRVSSTGDDTRDGSTWQNAKRTVQAAVDQAAHPGGEVWVQAGTYAENLTLRHFVYLYGGFDGTETNRMQRNWSINLSILDGSKSGRVITATGLQQWNEIDGFVIRNGSAPYGAGINCDYSAMLITHNTITNNVATVNVGTIGGGGIYCSRVLPSVRPLQIISNNISFNSAQSGGGMFLTATGTVIAFNRIEANTAAATPSSLGAGSGGGIYCGTANVINNFFLNNVATNGLTCGYTNGVFYNPFAGGAIYASTASSAGQIVNNTFLGNQAVSLCNGVPVDDGGGIYAAGYPAIANNLICFGSSGIEVFSSKAIRYNCVFGNNRNYIVADLTGTNGNISVNPFFTVAGDYHFASNSPCINAGDNSVVSTATDLDGQPRIAGATVDLGAYEFPSPASLISYAWLQQFGFLTDGSADFLDPDGDGHNNWQEWLAGTVPTDSTSVLRLQIPVNGASGTTVSWQSVSGRIYFLDRSSNLAGLPAFVTVQSNITAVSSITTVTDTNAVGVGPFFYRVGLQP